MIAALIFASILVSANAFHTSIMKSTRVSSSSLSMGDLVELCQFGRPRRLTFKTLYAAIAACGLEDTLKGPGPFTVFAPTDTAFAALPDGALDALLKDIPKLTKILTYHVAAGKMDGQEIQGMKKVPTLEGSSITISTDGKSFFTDDAKLVTVDIDVDNGWIHAIDMIMMPGQ